VASRLGDAEAAIELGAGRSVRLLAKSPRYWIRERALTIVAALPPFIATVGVFVDQTARLVNGVAARSVVNVAFTAMNRIRCWERLNAVVKAMALRVDDGRKPDALAVTCPAADRCVTTPDQRGGTGPTVDWKRQPSRPAGRCCWPAV
jgi:phosphoribosylanthranilate isomerase